MNADSIEDRRNAAIESFSNTSDLIALGNGRFVRHTGTYGWQETVTPGFPFLRFLINGYRVNFVQYCSVMGFSEAEVLRLVETHGVHQYRQEHAARLNSEAIAAGAATRRAWERENARQERRRS